MSGTPLQNNTFDIYAQMNFLNPACWEAWNFSNMSFAVPIDKFEKETNIIYASCFILLFYAEQKEQVAKIFAKQEMILFCEMGEEQRRIYDAYRNDYRDKILGTVEEQGLPKSQLTILQGLMKLRQICDSPAIIKVMKKNFQNASVKLDEIGREINRKYK